MKHQFMSDNSDSFPVVKMADIFNIHRSSYYRWLKYSKKRADKQKQREQALPTPKFLPLSVTPDLCYGGKKECHNKSPGKYAEKRSPEKLRKAYPCQGHTEKHCSNPGEKSCGQEKTNSCGIGENE